jgi:ABC-2 type transport system ATP-binding protein
MIETRGLTRHFRAKGQTVEAVRGIDLSVQAGELVAFLGPNGAGKTTTLRMLTTLLQPTSGTATVVGCDVVDDPAGVRRRIGFIGQGNSAGHAQRVRDEMVMQGRAYGLARRQAAARSDELLDALDLGGLADRVVSTLSGGQRRRLDVALGMVHRPELLFLDEPSTGLDPQNRANLQAQIERLRVEHATTIVLTTHYLDEADALADRVIVVDHGLVIADDTPERLKSHLAGDHMVLTAADPADVSPVAAAVERTGGAQHVEVAGAAVSARVRGGSALLPGLLRDLDAAGVVVAAAEVARPTLDDVFLALTGRSLRESSESPDADTSDGDGADASVDAPGAPVPSPVERPDVDADLAVTVPASLEQSS